jgi:hypothetical protein
MPDIKQNFFTNASPAPQQQMLQIAFSNDAKLRAKFGAWLYDNFDTLADEFKYYGRFLTLAEIEENPLQ